MSKARKAYWANKKDMSNKIKLAKNIASIYKIPYVNKDYESHKAHLDANEKLLKEWKESVKLSGYTPKRTLIDYIAYQFDKIFKGNYIMPYVAKSKKWVELMFWK